MGNAASSSEKRQQSVALPGTQVLADPASGRLGSSPIYRSALSPDSLIEYYYEGVTTVYHNFWQRGRINNPNGPCLGWRPPVVETETPARAGQEASSTPPSSPPPAEGSSSGAAAPSTSQPRFVIEPKVGPYKWLTYA
jgi:hypothetical protein